MKLDQIAKQWQAGAKLFFRPRNATLGGTFVFGTNGSLSYLNGDGNDSRVVLNARDFLGDHFETVREPTVKTADRAKRSA